MPNDRTGKVFRSYILAKGINRPMEDMLEVWMTSRQLSIPDNYSLTMSQIKGRATSAEIGISRIGYLIPSAVDSKNSDTNMPSTNYYEKLENYPASAYIFSKECPNDCYVRADWNYGTIASTHEQAYIKGKSSKYKLDEYWTQTYNFESVYNEEEYQIYNLDLNKVIEDIVYLPKATDVMIDMNEQNAMGDPKKTVHGDVLLLVAKPKDLTSSIPVAYIPLDKTHELSNGKFSVDWNNDGIMRLK